ncbi:MAG: 2-amino-4-hydroxy-6-hydroxymethyldihydropteridine diphosphokinase [Verrucomicrobiota bacterium]
MAAVVIGLGSNLGDSHQYLNEAIARLDPIRSTDRILKSSIYESSPIDCPPGSPAFLNAVVEIDSELRPLEILEFTQGLERDLGRRQKRALNEARTIDLDLLFIDDLVLDHAQLSLPHPRISERLFVLLPLKEIRPDLCPASLLNALENQDVRRRDDLAWED